jgi:hypothetical protein
MSETLVTSTPTLDHLRRRLVSVERMLATLHRVLLRRYSIKLALQFNTEPLPFDQQYPWTEEAKQNASAFMAARDQGDVKAALAVRQLRPRPDDPGDGAWYLYKMVDLLREQEALTEVLDWLAAFEKFAATRRPSEVHSAFASGLAPDRDGHCTCEEGEDLFGGVPSLEWYHRHHRLYNTAVYELLAHYGLIRGLRRRLLAALRGPVEDEFDGQPFKGGLLESYLRDLLGFVQVEPDPAWVNITQVIVAEADPVWQTAILAAFPDVPTIQVLPALNSDDAIALYKQHPDTSVVVIGQPLPCCNGECSFPEDLALALPGALNFFGYEGPIVASDRVALVNTTTSDPPVYEAYHLGWRQGDRHDLTKLVGLVLEAA